MDTRYASHQNSTRTRDLHRQWTSRRTATRRAVAFGMGSTLASSALLAACAAPGSQAGPEGGNLSQQPATLSFLGRGNTLTQETFKELSASFSEEHPQITVAYEHASSDFDGKYAVLAASDQTPDVGFSTVARFKGHIARGLAAKLDDLVKRDRQFKEKDYDAYWLQALHYKGQLAGLPWDPGMVVLYYNRNLFEKAGLKPPDKSKPMTWEDTLEHAQRLTIDSGGQVEQWGLELWWGRFWWQAPRQLGLLDIYQGDEGVLKIDHPTAIEGLQWLADLRTRYKVARPPGYSGPPTNFRNGKVAMWTSGAWAAGQTRKDLQDDWDWAPLPQFRGQKRVTMGQASPVILGAASKTKDQAWQLMKYLAGPNGQELAMERGISQPMLKAQHQSPAFTKHEPPHSPQVAVEETKYAVPPPYGPMYTEIQSLMDKVLEPVYKGEQSVRQAITASLPEFKQVLAEQKANFG